MTDLMSEVNKADAELRELKRILAEKLQDTCQHTFAFDNGYGNFCGICGMRREQ